MPRVVGGKVSGIESSNLFTCGDDALRLSSSFTLRVAVVAVAALSALEDSSWGVVDKGSDTTTTGLMARSASPLCD